jgi:ubiquinone/menaquinone biosynthesis C-methylase UbiE
LSESIKKVEELYNKRILSSNDGVQAAGQWGTKDFVPIICKEIQEKITIKKSSRVLELGCGSGVLGNGVFKNYDIEYVGIDLSSQMLSYFKDNLELNFGNLFQGLTNKIPFKGNTFDLVIINGVTMYFDNEKILEETINEIIRVSKKKSIVFIGENITKEVFPYEFVWFNKLSNNKQKIAKYYIQFRKKIARFKPLAGKWGDSYNVISIKLIKKLFEKNASIKFSKSSAYTIKEKMTKNYLGNRRIDIVIELKD